MHLICWGDSLTSGSDWMWYLDDLGHDWTWEDHGQPGEKSWQGTVRFSDWLQTAQPESGDVVVLMWGTNDVRKSWWTLDATTDELTEMANAAHAAGYPVAVIVPPPFTGGGSMTAETAGNYNARLEELEDGVVGIGDVQASAYDHWLGLPGFPDLSYYLHHNGNADGVHPGNDVSISGQPGRYHLAEPIAEVVLPEVGGAGLLLGALLVAALARWMR